MQHTPSPAPLIIQGAHFEFHEPQPLPTAQTFIANPPDRKQPEFYKFWVHKDGKNIGLLSISKKAEGLGIRTNKAVFTDNIARATKSPQMVFQLAQFDIPIDNKLMLNNAYNLERDKEIATKYCLDFEQQYIEFVSSQIKYIVIPPPTFRELSQEEEAKFLAEWKERYKGSPFPSVIISTEQQPQATAARISTPSGVVKID